MSSARSLSRRDLFAGAGVAAGALGALAGGVSLTTAAAQAAVDTRAYTSFSLLLEINGKFGGFCTGARGGGLGMALDNSGTSRSLGISTIEPLHVTLGPGLSADLLNWVTSRDGSTRDVSLVMFDQNYEEAYRLNLVASRVSGIALPVFTPDSKDVFSLDVDLIAASLSHEVGSRKKVSTQITKAKTHPLSTFRFYVQGLEPVAQYTRRVEGLAAERPVFALSPTGSSKTIDRELGPWTARPVRVITHFTAAAEFYKWQSDFMKRGDDRQALLQLLGADLKTVVASVDLLGVRPTLVTPPFETGPAIAVEMNVADMKFNLGGLVA